MTSPLKNCPFCGCAMPSDGGHEDHCYFTLFAAVQRDLSLAPAVSAAWNRRDAEPRATTFDGTDLRESSLAMMIRRLCSRTPDGKPRISDATREQALELLRSMGLEGSPLRSDDSGRDTPLPPPPEGGK